MSPPQRHITVYDLLHIAGNNSDATFVANQLANVSLKYDNKQQPTKIYIKPAFVYIVKPVDFVVQVKTQLANSKRQLATQMCHIKTVISGYYDTTTELQHTYSWFQRLKRHESLPQV